jgi:hypothetical protein
MSLLILAQLVARLQLYTQSSRPWRQNRLAIVRMQKDSLDGLLSLQTSDKPLTAV